MIDTAGLGAVTAQHRQVFLAHAAVGKLCGQLPRDVGGQAEQQHPRGGFVQPVHRIHPLTQLVSYLLQREAGFMPVDGTAVHQQTAGLVDCHQLLIAIDHFAGPLLLHRRWHRHLFLTALAGTIASQQPIHKHSGGNKCPGASHHLVISVPAPIMNP